MMPSRHTSYFDVCELELVLEAGPVWLETMAVQSVTDHS